MAPDHKPAPLNDEEQLFAVKTWRYLRLAMVALVIGLGVAIAFEVSRASPNDCFKTSISAYYYTPVHGYFVAALVGIGICLFCLKGNTEAEDALLNVAGIFAMFVALVPTQKSGPCNSVPDWAVDRAANIDNNVTALLVVLFIALAAIALLALKDGPPRSAVIGYVCALAVYVVIALFFLAAPDLFDRRAHFTAAILMFVCIFCVVVINAWEVMKDKKQTASSRRNFYPAVAIAMAAASVVIVVDHGEYWVIVIEGTLISLFAVFWGIQTWELWREGLRKPRSGRRPDASS